MAESTKSEEAAVMILAESPGKKLLLQKTGTGLEIAEARQLPVGHPVPSDATEVFHLQKTKNPDVYRKQMLYKPESNSRGPVRVSTPKFREGWDAVFSRAYTDKTLN